MKMSLKTLFVVLLVLNLKIARSQRNNVCNNLLSYSFKQFSSNCHYNPDVLAIMPELVTHHGYKVKSYDVTTEDGYILKVFNIPKDNAKGVIFLQHPATSWSDVWVDKGNVSLGFALWNAGYDIWMGNFRGTYYSRRHITWNPDKDYLQYWNFTFHEMGIYDLPAQIDLIVNETKTKQVTFIGHSMAPLAAAIYASLRKEHAENHIKKFIFMGPAILVQYTLYNIPLPLGLIVGTLYNLVKNTSFTEIFSRHSLPHELAKLICSSEAIGIIICQKLIGFAFGGRRFNIIDWEQIPVTFGQYFGGMAVKTFNHYAQNLRRSDRKVSFYNYGKALNQRYYNSDQPPVYPFERINISTHIMAGTLDRVGTLKDCTDFYNLLKENSNVSHTFAALDYGHADFSYANNLEEQINEPIVKILSDNN